MPPLHAGALALTALTALICVFRALGAQDECTAALYVRYGAAAAAGAGLITAAAAGPSSGGSEAFLLLVLGAWVFACVFLRYTEHNAAQTSKRKRTEHRS